MPADRAKSRTPLARILANTAWLLGGKGFGAICSIVYLVILTRTLGLKGFGHFSLIFGTAQALIAIAGFQTWQVVVRYGSEHVHREDWDRFGRLGMLCGLLDAVGAILGCAIAAIVIYGFAHQLDINPGYVDIAFWFSCAALWALTSAPTGIVRALHRFDVAVYVEAIVPTGRLLCALLIWWTGPSVGRFLFAWAAIDILESLLYWATAKRLCPRAVRFSNLLRWREALAENEGIGRFFMVTYASATLNTTMKNGPLLAVGALISTRAAGLYRLAAQLSDALSKLSTLLSRSVYAEVARVRVASHHGEFRKLALQTSFFAALAGFAVVGLALVAGRQLLGLIGGEEFEGGAAILVPLAIAASFDLASVAFEPVLHSTGKARLSLTARALAVVALGIGLFLFVDLGPSGVAWAVCLGTATSYLVMGVMAYFTLQRLPHGGAADPLGTLPEGPTSTAD